MAINNILLYNTALSGYISGQLAGSYQIDPTQADYAGNVSQAVIFATAMDAAIAPDIAATPQPATTGPISTTSTNGIAIPPTTAAITEAIIVKPQLLQALCFGFSFQRYQQTTPAVPAANFTVAIAAIKAIYFQTLLSASYSAT